MQNNYKPMLIPLLPQLTYDAIESLSKEKTSEWRFKDLPHGVREELYKVYQSQPVPVSSDIKLFYYLLSTGNYALAPEKRFRVILQDNKSRVERVWRYYFLSKSGEIRTTDTIDNVDLINESKIPERFRRFAVEAKEKPTEIPFIETEF